MIYNTALAAAAVYQNPVLLVGNQRLAPYAHARGQVAVLTLPEADVEFVRGAILPAQIGSHRPSYIKLVKAEKLLYGMMTVIDSMTTTINILTCACERDRDQINFVIDVGPHSIKATGADLLESTIIFIVLKLDCLLTKEKIKEGTNDNSNA